MKFNNYNNFFENTDKPIAFILGNSFVTELGAIRSLGRKGIPTVVLDSKRRQISFYSKYCKGIACPHPKYDEREYIEFLLDLGENLNTKGVLIPTAGIEILPILKNRHKLEKYYNFTMPKLDVVDIFENKRKIYETLEKMGIPHAKTIIPNDISDVIEISKDMTYPCIVKPAYSGSFELDFNTKLFTAKSKEELIQNYDKATARNHNVVIQEIIPGEASNTYGFNAYYNHNFNPIGVFTCRRIREWPHMFGNGCFLQTVKQPELEEIITPLVKKNKYYGIIDADFKKDPRDGIFKLGEINPRAWMQNSMPTRCGINHVHMAYMDAIGKTIEKPEPIKDHVKWVYMLDDIASSIEMIRKGKLTIHDWLKSYKGEKEYAVFAWDDIFPSFVLFAELMFNSFPNYLKRRYFNKTVSNSKSKGSKVELNTTTDEKPEEQNPK